MSDKIEAADLFCGGGGSSTGLVEACKALSKKVDLVAVNHWPRAVETHTRNHPWATHYCQDIQKVNPRKAVPSGHLDILLAGAPCPHFSSARGGKPMDDRQRSLPKEIHRWHEELDVENILIENVKEFVGWGPLHKSGVRKGKPIRERKGEYFKTFISRIERSGYTVEHQVLNAANYGAATTRRRLFIMARKNRPIRWPKETHSEENWKAAREVIDWSIQGESIFNRKKPLADKTIARIAAGIRKFCGEWAEPFLILLYGTGSARSIDKPLPTITSGGGRGGGHVALCEFILQQQSGGVPRKVGDPLPTIAGKGAQALVQPFIISAGGPEGQGRNPKDMDTPLGTIMTEDHKALVSPVVEELSPYLVNMKGQSTANSIDKPAPTQTAGKHLYVAQPYIVKYFGTGVPHPVTEPLPTLTTKDRVGLVQCGETTYGLDIKFRMLQPKELARAMGFREDYEFTGNRGEVVKMVGNAWEIHLARALCAAALTD